MACSRRCTGLVSLKFILTHMSSLCNFQHPSVELYFRCFEVLLHLWRRTSKQKCISTEHHSRQYRKNDLTYNSEPFFPPGINKFTQKTSLVLLIFLYLSTYRILYIKNIYYFNINKKNTLSYSYSSILVFQCFLSLKSVSTWSSTISYPFFLLESIPIFLSFYKSALGRSIAVSLCPSKL